MTKMGQQRTSQSEDIQRNGKKSVFGRDKVNANAWQLFRLTVNEKSEIRRDAWKTVSVFPDNAVSRDSDEKKITEEQTAVDEMRTSDENTDFDKDYETGSIRCIDSRVRGISMRSIELF